MKNFSKRFFKYLFLSWLLISNISYGNNLENQSDSTYVAQKRFICRTYPFHRGFFLPLNIGESINFENGMITFTFSDVLEYTGYNSSVLIEVEYDSWNTTIELNSDRDPRSYNLDNGYGYVVRMKELKFSLDGYQVVLEIKKGGFN